MNFLITLVLLLSSLIITPQESSIPENKISNELSIDTINEIYSSATLEEIEFVRNLGNPISENCEYEKIWGYSSFRQSIAYESVGEEKCEVIAVGAGKVAYAGFDPDNFKGYMVLIEHDNGLFTEYSRGDGKFYVGKGDIVSKGNRIMNMGNSGLGEEEYLTFRLLKSGVSVDPVRMKGFSDIVTPLPDRNL